MTPSLRKGPEAFRTISEASAEVGVPQHVLRFWETKFAFVRPMKRAGGRRFYRPQDLQMLRGVRSLLQEEGYTIKGVQRLHKEGGVRRLVAAAGVTGEDAAALERAIVEAEAEAPSGPEDAAGVADVVAHHDLDPADLLDAAARPAAPAPRPPPRHVLDPASRARLADVLRDLEATKADVDALLRAGADW